MPKRTLATTAFPLRRVNSGMRHAALILIAAAMCHAEPPFAFEVLRAHNQQRARVGTSPLIWSAELAASSQEWADTLLRSGEFRHRTNPVHGANLFEIDGARAPVAQVVETWAAEAAAYDYRTNSCRTRCGHYTQIVWAETRSVGCAVARNAWREVWVCEYDPPGNIVGQRPW